VGDTEDGLALAQAVGRGDDDRGGLALGGRGFLGRHEGEEAVFWVLEKG
jgi:hypothetical protein